ncbi:MAG: hypothetical protein WAV00_16840 [Nocardioides sp.]
MPDVSILNWRQPYVVAELIAPQRDSALEVTLGVLALKGRVTPIHLKELTNIALWKWTKVGEQDAQPAGATADVNSPHLRAEIPGLLDGLSHRHLPLRVAGIVVPRRCRLVEPLVFVHMLDRSPDAASRYHRLGHLIDRALQAGTPGSDAGR